MLCTMRAHSGLPIAVTDKHRHTEQRIITTDLLHTLVADDEGSTWSSSVVLPSVESSSNSAKRSCSFVFPLSTLKVEGDPTTIFALSFCDNFKCLLTDTGPMVCAFTLFTLGFGAPAHQTLHLFTTVQHVCDLSISRLSIWLSRQYNGRQFYTVL